TNYQDYFNDKISYSGTPEKGRKPSGAVMGTALTLPTKKHVEGEEEHTEEGEGDHAEPSTDGGEEDEEGEIIPVFKPAKHDAVFYGKEPIKYLVTLSNKYKIKQEGTFSMVVETERGKQVSVTTVKVKIPRKGMKKFYVTVPTPPEPGIYMLRAATNTTTYDDTAALAFGYEINKIQTPYYLPPDFDDFWREALAELATVDPQYKITPDPGQSTKYHDVYRVDMMGLGNVPFYGYLSIPKLKGKYPVVVGYGGYEKFVPPLLFVDYITFAVNVRNLEKASKELVNPENQKQLLVNIENKDQYIYRGIYMDCVRALEFVYSNPDKSIDLNKVIAFGGSQGASLGIITAALMPNKFSAVVASNPVFADWKNSLEIGFSKRSLAFPAGDIQRYFISNPGTTSESLLPTLHYFDLQNFMPKVSCPILYGVGLLDEFIPPGSALAAFNKLSPAALRKSELFIFPRLGHEIPNYHNSFIGNWFAEQTAGGRKK
ncbi:MAG: hypothetical protein EAZ62_04540, partial [Sphingobacteriia bacterium]